MLTQPKCFRPLITSLCCMMAIEKVKLSQIYIITASKFMVMPSLATNFWFLKQVLNHQNQRIQSNEIKF